MRWRSGQKGAFTISSPKVNSGISILEETTNTAFISSMRKMHHGARNPGNTMTIVMSLIITMTMI